MFELLKLVAKRKTLVAVVTLLFFGLAAVAALLISPRFEATVLMAPSNSSSALSSAAAGGLSGLASIAGIAIPQDDNTVVNVARLESQLFTLHFVREHGIDKEMYPKLLNPDSGEWLADSEPSGAQVFKDFERKYRRINVDASTGLVSLSILWPNPETAAKIANEMAAAINQEIRELAVEESQRSIQYLENQLSKTNILEIEQVIFRLMEEQFKSRMMAEVDPEFAFKVIDPAQPPDANDPVQPKVLMMLLIGLLVGMLLSIFLVIVLESR